MLYLLTAVVAATNELGFGDHFQITWPVDGSYVSQNTNFSIKGYTPNGKVCIGLDGGERNCVSLTIANSEIVIAELTGLSIGKHSLEYHYESNKATSREQDGVLLRLNESKIQFVAAASNHHILYNNCIQSNDIGDTSIRKKMNSCVQMLQVMKSYDARRDVYLLLERYHNKNHEDNGMKHFKKFGENVPEINSAIIMYLINNEPDSMNQLRRFISIALLETGTEMVTTTSLNKREHTVELLLRLIIDKIDPSYGAAHLMLGIIYRDQGKTMAGMVFMTHGVKLTQKENYDNYRAGGKAMAYKLPRPTSGRSIVVIYCDNYGDSWWSSWGPLSDVKGGVGGSEEAVIFMSRELSKLGYWVEVYGNPSEENYGMDTHGVSWYPVEAYDASYDAAPDIFIAWRYAISTGVAMHNTVKRYLWLQDHSDGIASELTDMYIEHLERIFVLSDYHKRALPHRIRYKVFVTPNGLNPEHFVQQRKDSNFDNNDDHERLELKKNTSFIYASSPERGLHQLLLAWPRIYNGIPGGVATLTVYYGFTPGFMKHRSKTIPNFDAWYREMLQLLQQPGVIYKGMVNHIELAQAYAQASFFLYPTQFSETGCISLLKAQAMGALPITSRLKESALPEIASDFDLGPIPGVTNASESFHNMEWMIEKYVPSVIEAHFTRKDVLDELREHMIAWTREHYAWSTIANTWDKHFRNILPENPSYHMHTLSVEVL